MLKKSAVFAVALVLMIVPFSIGAQPNQGVATTLEDLTMDPDAYMGQTVTLEGYVSEFLNATSFVLGEGATIDDDQVLVINTTGESLPANVFRDDYVMVTGIVHPSLQMRIDWGEITLPEDRLLYRRTWAPNDVLVDPIVPTPEDASNSPEATLEVTAESIDAAPVVAQGSWHGFDFYYGGGYPEGYDGHLILEITSISAVRHFVTE